MDNIFYIMNRTDLLMIMKLFHLEHLLSFRQLYLQHLSASLSEDWKVSFFCSFILMLSFQYMENTKYPPRHGFDLDFGLQFVYIH